MDSLICHCKQSYELGLVHQLCMENLTCKSNSGCYQQKFYSFDLDKVLEKSECLDHQKKNITKLCEGVYNNKTNIFMCCYSDYCNKDLLRALLVEPEQTIMEMHKTISPAAEISENKGGQLT